MTGGCELVLAEFIRGCVLLFAVLAEELVLFAVLFCIFPALAFCPKAKVDGNSNDAVIRKNKKAPVDTENNKRCFG